MHRHGEEACRECFRRGDSALGSFSSSNNSPRLDDIVQYYYVLGASLVAGGGRHHVQVQLASHSHLFLVVDSCPWCSLSLALSSVSVSIKLFCGPHISPTVSRHGCQALLRVKVFLEAPLRELKLFAMAYPAPPPHTSLHAHGWAPWASLGELLWVGCRTTHTPKPAAAPLFQAITKHLLTLNCSCPLLGRSSHARRIF